jgi:hypothetical protein
VDVLPSDVITLPRVLGSDLIDYLTSTAAAVPPCGPGTWDPFAEAAEVVDPEVWYTTRFDATPWQSVTRWLPPPGSGLPSVSVYSVPSGHTVLITHGRGGSR